MSKLTVNPSGTQLMLDGRPFFYLADTIWSAFTNVTMEEWDAYLKKRKEQGFNVLQINTLPQWDRCMADTGLYPFETADRQIFDFTKPNEAYYEQAKAMCQRAVEEGFHLALAVLWLNFVPGTWGSRYVSGNMMPKEMVEPYVRKVVSEFDRFDPLYLVSGDTDFDTPESIAWYGTALRVLNEESPASLKGFHIKRGYDFIPAEFLGGIDFYLFQSGHNADGQDMAYILPERFRVKYPVKPLINSEPCYEQMGYSRKKYGRFRREETRKAAWTSVLSGASAGVTYGAHGVWNWKKENSPVNPIMGEGFDTAFPVEKALCFPGAADYGFLKSFFEERGLPELSSAQYLLANDTEEIRVAKGSNSCFYIYVPYSTRVTLKMDIPNCTVRAFDLASGTSAEITAAAGEGKTVIPMHPFYYDAVLELTV